MLRVYLSSSMSDLQEYRQQALDGLRRFRATPIAIEDFAATTASSVEVCARALIESDLVVLILAHRYGVVPAGGKASMVELDFDLAVETAKPVLAFVVDDRFPWPRKFRDTGELRDRLVRFKERLQQTLVPERFTTSSDFGLRLINALSTRFATESAPADSNQNHQSQERQTDVLIRVEGHLQRLLTGFDDVQSNIDSMRQRDSVTQGKLERPMISPPGFLGSMADDVDQRLCFIAMPYSKTWSKALQTILADICGEEDFRIVVAKDMAGRFIPNDIWRGITGSRVVIADITDGNPNVAYELGLADVLGKEIILLCQGDLVPFDFLGQRLIQYNDTMEGTIKLREELGARLRELKLPRIDERSAR